jgi:hypothetical protein
VHRDSQYDADDVNSYLGEVHSLILEAAANNPKGYFGTDLRPTLRTWSDTEREVEFDASIALSATDTQEVAINPSQLAQAVRRVISAHPRIIVRLGRIISRAEQHERKIVVFSEGAEGSAQDSFDHVVNALWDGRMALNETLGIRANRPWLHRLKYGVSLRLAGAAVAPRSVTFVSGPFGEVVSYGSGLTYLTWYPACVKGISREVSPPDWATYPIEPVRSDVVTGTCKALAEIVRPLHGLDPTGLAEVSVKGGVIVAWGNTDIYDPGSELHRRYEIGVQSNKNFHSIDPGKLTMVPYFAEVCANRIKSLD